MVGTLGIATLDTVVDLSGLNQGLGTAEQKTKGAFGGMQKAAGLALAGIAAGAGVAAVKVLKDIVSLAISVESAFAGVIKTTDGLTDSAGNLTEEGVALREGFRDLATEIPADIEELMGIGELGGQLGIARENLLEFTETMAAMGEATNLTSEEAATGFAQIANIMGTAQTDIDRMGSSVVALGNNMATTEADILGFSQNIAGAGAIAGLTEAEVFGIGAAFSSVGIEAAAGGTATQKVLLGMNAAVMEGGANLETFAATAGMSAEEFGAAWQDDAGGVFTDFVEGLGAAGDDAVGILSDLGLEDQRLIKSFLSLSGAGDLLSESIGISTDAWAENTALSKEAAQRYATTESQIQLFKNTLRDVGLTIGDMLLPALQLMLGALQPLITGFGFLVQGDIEGFFEGLFFAISNVAVALGMSQEEADGLALAALNVIDQIIAFKDQVLTFLEPFISLITQFVSWKDVLVGLGLIVAATVLPIIGSLLLTIAGILAPILLVIAAVALLRNAWENNWGGIQEKTALVIEFVKEIIANGLAFIQEFWAAHGETIIATVQNLFAIVSEAVSTALAAIQAWWSEHGESVMALLTAYWAFVSALFQTAFDIVLGIVTTVLTSIQTFWTEHGDAVMDVVGTLWETLQSIFETAILVLTTVFQAFTAALEGDWSTFGELIGDAWDATWALVQSTLDTALEAIKTIDWGAVGTGIINGITAGVTNAAQALIDAVVQAAKDALAAVQGALGMDSPSKVFMEVGANIDAGWAEGVTDHADLVTRAVTDVAADVTMLPEFAPADLGSVSNVRSTNFEIGGTFTGPQTPADLGEFVRMQRMLAQ